MSTDDDPVRRAMEGVADALAGIEVRVDAIKDRLSQVQELRDEGFSYAEIAARLDGAPTVELLSGTIDALAEATSRLRRTAAAELQNEGMSMENIAKLFGVSRQRIGVILREAQKP